MDGDAEHVPLGSLTHVSRTSDVGCPVLDSARHMAAGNAVTERTTA